MIISHRHRFIFVRTRKVASSSVEIALSEHLEAQDFATRQSDRERASGKVMPDFDSRWFGGFDRRLRPVFIYGHAPLTAAYRMFGDRIADYRVFSIERNPWDRAVSTFYWSMRGSDMRARPIEDQRAAFRAYLTQAAHPGWRRRWFGINAHRDLSQSWLYRIGDVPMVDMMLRYECIDDDLARLSDFLGLDKPLSVAGVNAKTGHRSSSSRDYQSFYDDRARAEIARACAWECETLGYRFDGGIPPAFSPDPARAETRARYLARVCRGRAGK